MPSARYFLTAKSIEPACRQAGNCWGVQKSLTSSKCRGSIWDDESHPRPQGGSIVIIIFTCLACLACDKILLCQ